MTDRYAMNGVGGASPYASWAAANVLATALGAVVAGDRYFGGDTYSENAGAGITLTGPTGGPSAQIIGANVHATTEPPTGVQNAPTTYCSLQTGGNFQLTIRGFLDFFGWEFRAGAAGDVNSNINICSGLSSNQVFDTCLFRIGSSNSGPRINFGQASGSLAGAIRSVSRNCKVRFGNVGQSIAILNGDHRFTGLTIDAATSVPTTLFTGQSSGLSICEVLASDLSAVSITNLVDLSGTGRARWRFSDVKLPSGCNLFTGSIASPGACDAIFENVDSGNTNYKFKHVSYGGVVDADIATYRTGGANDGTRGISAKMTPTSGQCTYFRPLRPLTEYMVPCNSTGSKTLSAFILRDSVTALTNAQIGIAAIALDDSGSPRGAVVRSRIANVLASGSAISAGGSWTNAMTNPNAQQIDLAITMSQKGYVQWWPEIYDGTIGAVYVCQRGAVA